MSRTSCGNIFYLNRDYAVKLLDGFLSRSWLDYISFGNFGTGGWSNGDGHALASSRIAGDFAAYFDSSAFEALPAADIQAAARKLFAASTEEAAGKYPLAAESVL